MTRRKWRQESFLSVCTAAFSLFRTVTPFRPRDSAPDCPSLHASDDLTHDPSKPAYLPLLEWAPMLVSLRPSSKLILIVRGPGGTNTGVIPSLSSCAFCEQQGWFGGFPLSEAARCTSTEDEAPSPSLLREDRTNVGALSIPAYFIAELRRATISRSGIA